MTATVGLPIKLNCRILIVDDDESDCRYYSELIMQQPAIACEVRLAADGAAGLAALRTSEFDCVLLDFYLPDMTGLEFLTDASSNGILPCAFVLVTGQGNEATALEAMKRGALDYLVKQQINASSLWRAMTSAMVQVDLRHAKEAAEHASQAKTRFVTMVTHELRTPLNGILGYAQLLRIEGGLSVGQDMHVARMMQAGKHLLSMIYQVLDFASIEAGRLQLNPERVLVSALIDESVAFIGPVAAEHGLSLRTVRSHDAPQHITADPSRLRQVLLNLLGNAVKYTQTGGIELRIAALSDSGGLRIEIADTGTGIDPVYRQQLFQDFERLGAPTSVEGAGLGLAITARIVRLMNGTIGHLDNPGGGSVFWLELPPDQPEFIEAASVRPSSGARVLLADDIKMNRDVVGGLLCAAGHTVLTAANGREASQMAFEQTFDIILMDIRMPEMDGLEATRRIRSLPAPYGTVPILALTAQTSADQIAECRKAGMDGHIAKPVDYATLVSSIDEAITRVRPDWHGADSRRPDRQPPGPVPNQTNADPAPAADRPRLPVRLDRSALRQTLSCLTQEQANEMFAALRLRMQEMLALLDQPGGANLRSNAAHVMVSTAGMFGFLALSEVARTFELAVADEAADAERLLSQLREETVTALGALDQLIREPRFQPA